MDAEIQRRRTFEIIAKWIGKHHGVTINFQPNAVPHADPKTRQIFLPSNMKIENLDKVLALVFHEAGHIAHSGRIDIKKLCENKADKDALNGAEDVRIDRKMIDYLPKIRDFYDELVKWEDETYPPDKNPNKIPVPVLALLDAMRMANNLCKIPNPDPKVQQFITKHNLISKINNLDYQLDMIENYRNPDAEIENYRNPDAEKEAKKQVKELSELIFGKQPKQPNAQGQGQGEGEGEGEGQGAMPGDCKGDKEPNGKGKGTGDGKPAAGQGQSNGKEEPTTIVIAIKGGGGFYGRGDLSKLFEIDPNAKYALDDISLTEQTLQAFNELLTVKSIRIIHDGVTLDTDNLTAFFTGAVDELFKEVKIEKQKKSKIMFLLDSSGSMQGCDQMCDDQYKSRTLISVGHKLTEILKELQEVEGVNVDFCVRGFDDSYHVWDKDEWEKEYAKCPGGGTQMEMAFREAQKEILEDKTIDGNKMIIMITDGQVHKSEIQNIKDLIIKNSSDVKCMLLGIGLYKGFEEILGGRNIISKELADGVILEAIEDLLD